MSTNDALNPINLSPFEEPEYSGFLIVRLSSSHRSDDCNDLKTVASQAAFNRLEQLLDRHRDITTQPLIRSISPEQLQQLERRAMTVAPNLQSRLGSYWRLDCRNLSEAQKEQLLQELQDLPEVNLAYRERSVTDPMIDADSNPYAVNQGYLNAAPEGIDARWAWTHPYGRGAGVGVIDLEQGWFPNHEDLIAKTPTLIFNDNRDGVGTYKGNHGAAVLGEIVGVDNDIGIIGIAPEVTSVRMVSHYEAASDTTLHVADAILAAIAVMPPGDVLLLEVQRSFLPTEVDPADFDAIQLAVNLGIIVVEAAGNGDFDLDDWTDSMGQRLLNRNDPAFADSGAIMVGSSVSTVPHDRFVGCGLGCGSNYGSRIDCYGWGQNITTAGYGDLDPGTGDDSTYTSTFGGTSGASPMVTGAALILQGIYEAIHGTRLSPAQMRDLLANPATGTPQGENVAGHINVMPNLRAIIESNPDFRIACEVYVPIGLKIPIYIEPEVSAKAPDCQPHPSYSASPAVTHN
jgi:serine protease